MKKIFFFLILFPNYLFAVDPTSFSGLQVWSKADIFNSNPDNVSVSSWTDSSGNGNTFTSVGSPKFRTNIQNGLPMISLVGASTQYFTNDGLASVFSGTNLPFTFFLVLKHSDVERQAKHQNYFIAALEGNGASINATHDLYFDDDRFSFWSDRRDSSGGVSNELSVGGGTPDTKCHVLVYVFDGTNGFIYEDSTLIAQQNQQNVHALTVDGWTIGAHRRTTIVDSPMNGYFGEVGLYNVALSTTNINSLFVNYLTPRWATPSSAPTDAGTINPSALQAWYRDDSISNSSTALPLANNDLVDTWTSKCCLQGANQDLGASGSARPTFKTNIQNGRPMILFDGANSFMSYDPFSSLQNGTQIPYTAFFVAQAVSYAGANQDFYGWGHTANTKSLERFIVIPDISQAYYKDRRDDTNTYVFAQESSDTADTSFHRYIVSFTGTNCTVYKDGSVISGLNNVSLSVGGLVVDEFTVGGQRRNTGLEEPFNGYIGEFGLYNVALSGSQATNLDNYLAARWIPPPIDTPVLHVYPSGSGTIQIVPGSQANGNIKIK